MLTCNWTSRFLPAIYPLSWEKGKTGRKRLRGNLNDVIPYAFKQHLNAPQKFSFDGIRIYTVPISRERGAQVAEGFLRGLCPVIFLSQ